MKFDSAGKLEEIIWQSRIADLPRSENRAILQRMYGGEPPFDEAEAEANGIEINRNDLTGVNLLAQARRQWNSAFLTPKHYFNVTLNCGPANKRQEWGSIITRHINRQLRRCPKMREQIRATGANVMLHGIGPVNWSDRQTPVPSPIPVASLLIPSETDIDFENLEWFAVFREWTVAQLYTLTHGPKRDPGWNMDLVMQRLKYTAEQTQKEINAGAYQYMPERIEELVKQDMGYWGSDAVPTIDVWDFYFKENGCWYRRVLLDWGVSADEITTSSGKPKSPNQVGDKQVFLYSSGKRKYAIDHSEIFHCQFGDTSAYAPFKYHSVRSLGWMLWGACDLQNRLYCKFMENVFMNLLWWFRVSGEQAFNRLKRAEFFHMGVIPNGVSMVTAQERFMPDPRMVELGFAHNQRLLAENSASFTSDFAKGESGKEMTATETMARVNSVNALVSGLLALAYSYEESKHQEIARRFCIPNSRDSKAGAFRRGCLKDGVPSNYLTTEAWDIEAERVIGGGNKTIEMATVNFLNSIRKNLGPRGQRIVDHISVFSATDQPDLADQIAPLDDEKPISDSQHDAQLATDRLMRGLPFIISPKMIPEEYIQVWLADMALMIDKATQAGNMATAEEISGWQNMEQHIAQFLNMMAINPDDMPRVRQYAQSLAKLMNLVKAFAQRLAEQLKQQQAAGGANGAGEEAAKTAAKLESDKIMAQAKAENQRTSHAQKTAQRQVQFEMEQSRKDRELEADIRRKNLEADQKLQAEVALVEQELRAAQLKAELESRRKSEES